MAFQGYIRYGGVELVNNARLSVYADNLGLDFYRCDYQCPTLEPALEELGWKLPGEVYSWPVAGAPWYDPTEPNSAGFAGVHVLEWTNIDSSTYTSTPNELTGDGGSISGERYRSREMVVRCLLLGSDLLAVRHGFNWLATVLREGDPCAKNVRKRHTYADFLPYGKPWWAVYKSTGATATPDNVYQAVRYNGLSTTDDPVDGTGIPGSGNTYAKLSHAEADTGIQPPVDVLDILIPITDPEINVPSALCGGNRLEFFVQCPTAADVTQVYRHSPDVYLQSGPTILGEHEIGPGCDGGAWYEIEFTLSGTNPFVWRWPVNMLAQPNMFSYGQVLSKWLFYKETVDYAADNDVYQAPLVWGERHTYNGLISAMFDIAAGAQPPALTTRIITQDTRMVMDPLCPPMPAYPTVPQEDFVCAPIYNGPRTVLKYSFLSDTLPKFSPTTVRFMLRSLSTSDMRDILVRLIPPSGSEVPTSIVEFLVTYLPPRSAMFIDGVRRSIDIRTGDPSDASSLVWSPAEHLVHSGGAAGSYTFPEVTCGSNVTLAIEVPDIYNAADLEFDLVAIQRDA